MSLAYDLHLAIAYLSRCSERLEAAGEDPAASHVRDAFQSLRLARTALAEPRGEIAASWIPSALDSDRSTTEHPASFPYPEPEDDYPEVARLDSLATPLNTRRAARRAARRLIRHAAHYRRAGFA